MTIYNDDMYEGYLDLDEEIKNYNTDYINGNNIIDIHHTGMSFYDNLLNFNNNIEVIENFTTKIVTMSPEEYYTECAKICWYGTGVTVARLKYERGTLDVKIIENLKMVIQKYKRKLCIPLINYVDHRQQGLHRMYAIGELYGWDFKVPVLIITHATEK